MVAGYAARVDADAAYRRQAPCPVRGDDGEEEQAAAVRIEEERRLMYVGITRARSTLVVSTLARRKRGCETVAGFASRPFPDRGGAGAGT